MPNRFSTPQEGQEFKAEDFSKQSLENSCFTNCSFQSCNFTAALLRNAKFCSCVFKNCNLSLTKLDGCRLQDGQFVDCKIVGADFFKCEKMFFSVRFENCLLHTCNFSDLTMKNFSFCRSRLRECYFTNTSLKGADFEEVDLKGTTFHNCDLSQADFSKAIQYDIDPRTNQIKGAKFSLPEAVGLLRSLGITLV